MCRRDLQRAAALFAGTALGSLHKGLRGRGFETVALPYRANNASEFHAHDPIR